MFWQHYLENKNQLSSLVLPNKFMLPFWNLNKITSFFRTVKPTIVESMKFPWDGFCKTATIRKK